MILIISILICFSITYIITQGVLFDPIKKWLLGKYELNENITSFSFENGLPTIDMFKDKKKAEYILNNIKIYQVILEKDTVENEEDKIKSLTAYTEQLKVLMKKENSIFKRKTFIYNKLYYLSNCILCMGFWVGLFFTIMTQVFDINVYGTTLNLVGSCNILATFFLGCMFSGTSWIIYCIITYLGDGQTPSAIIHSFNHED